MRSLLVSVAASTVVLVGCAGTETASTQQSATPSSPATAALTSPSMPMTRTLTTEATPGTIITTADSEFGEILFDDTGQAIYLFDREETTTPECYDECTDEWPPVLTEGTPVAAGGADADALGATIRSDGSTQVTYRGHPLYYYAHEGKNQVLCHNVSGFGGLWLVLAPTGDPAAS
jgi:predicted lipoprotein with Yx(FWY)xxD motif